MAILFRKLGLRTEGSNMSTYNLAVKDKNGKYKHHKVPYDVYIYVRQLEAYIKHPEESKLKEFYSDRFGKKLTVELTSGETPQGGIMSKERDGVGTHGQTNKVCPAFLVWKK